MVYYSIKLFVSGQLYWTLGFGGVLLSCKPNRNRTPELLISSVSFVVVFLFNIGMRLSTVSKGSSYGREAATKKK